jgi:triphosphoribosyl-dephospho-CoA synthase
MPNGDEHANHGVPRTMSPFSPGQLAELACLLEVTARKPGNVHRFLDLADLHFLDFLLSASAIRQPLDRAAELGVGTAVLKAVEATRQVVSTNTNLGMILLLAPLAAIPVKTDLAHGVERVLDETTVEDARQVFRAIRMAGPGGLGRVAEQDVADEPTVTLRAAMALAAGRDLVARQYANGFREVLDEALPLLGQSIRDGLPLESTIVLAFLRLLARHPDTLVSRKAGPDAAAHVSRRAGEILAAGWPETSEGSRLIAEFDFWLRGPAVALNPGTTADLVTAALFAALRDGTIQLPRLPGTSNWSET